MEFRSGLGDSKRVLQVKDPEMERIESSELRAEVDRMRAENDAERVKVSPVVKSRFEVLTGIGRIVEDVTIGGVTFTLKSLKAREAQSAMLEMAKFGSGTEQIFYLRAHTLAMAIMKIDGVDANIVFGGVDLKGKIDILFDMEEEVLNKLYTFHLNMVKSKNSDLGETSEEVNSNIKKS